MTFPGLDPMLSLASTARAASGGIALLLGSGTSRSAGLPTGWEITLELVRRTAPGDAEAAADPAGWWEREHGDEPNYSDLVEAFAKTPQARRDLLDEFVGPTEDRGQPQDAHRSIARLAAAGQVKSIVTTNFDRLLERALEDEGVQPAIVSQADQIAGMRGLAQAPCTIVKVHGDVNDANVRNTDQELAAYDDTMTALLHRIFDEYPLVICGWSGDWDEALREVLLGSPGGRYPTYAAVRGTPSDTTERIMGARGGQVINIADADAFFVGLEDAIVALDQVGRAAPGSVELAVANVKRWLQPPARPIDLADLFDDLATRARDAAPDNYGQMTSTSCGTSWRRSSR